MANQLWRQRIAESLNRINTRERDFEERLSGLKDEVLCMKKMLAALMSGVDAPPMEFYALPTPPSYPPGPLSLCQSKMRDMEAEIHRLQALIEKTKDDEVRSPVTPPLTARGPAGYGSSTTDSSGSKRDPPPDVAVVDSRRKRHRTHL